MERIDLPHPSRGVFARPAIRVVIIVLAALLLVVVSAPWTVRPFITSWTKPTPAPMNEAWPTAPATYVPPPVGEPAVQRVLPTATPLPPPDWRDLGYLTSIEFTTTSVVESKRKTNVPWVGEMVTDRLLLRVVGEVQVGIDLREVTDMQIDGKAIRLRAPKPEVTSVELLPNESQIFEREQVLFMSQYTGMEKEALETARQQLRQEVSDNESMMQLAEEFARLHLTEFLRQAGFETVTIEFAYSRADD